jgi:transcriptional regulator with XRE-family HTH domain
VDVADVDARVDAHAADDSGWTAAAPVVKMDAVGLSPEGQAETIGQRLRRLRHERGLSQRELASPGVSYAYISRIEAGARRPSVKALRMLARKLGVSADYLETGSEIRDVDERELRIADAELGLRLDRDTDRTETALRELHDEAVAAGDAVAASRANLALGMASAAAGRSAEAIERLEAGLEVAPVSPSVRPDVFATLGCSYTATGRPDLAVELFERCLGEVGEDTPDDLAAEVRFTTHLSDALNELDDVEGAQSVLDAALERADELTDAYARVRLFRSLARLNDVRGRPLTALAYARRAIALLAVADDTLHLARAHLLRGDILLGQGRAEEAGRQFELAEELFGANPASADVGSLYTDRRHAEAYRAWGEFLRRAGREDDALEVLARAAGLAAEPAGTDTLGAR